MTAYTRSALALVVMLFAVGCSSVQTPMLAFSDDGQYLPGEAGDGIVASPNPLIPDVPMPVGFKAVADQSSSSFDGRVRVVRHVYQGRANQGDAISFYRRTLPAHNWALVEIQSVGESTVLRYSKGPEKLAITAAHSWGVSTLTIDIDGR